MINAYHLGNFGIVSHVLLTEINEKGKKLKQSFTNSELFRLVNNLILSLALDCLWAGNSV